MELLPAPFLSLSSSIVRNHFDRATQHRGTVKVLCLADSIEGFCPSTYCVARCFGPRPFVSELIYYDPIISALPARFIP